MDLKNYQKFVMDCPLFDDVIYGLIGELGEVVEPYKKSKRTGDRHKPLNKEEWIKELGDVFWYLTRLAGSEGISLEEILEVNYKKLSKRHGISEV